MATKNEKAMGPYGSPMASIPPPRLDLRATLTKIKKEIKVKHFDLPNGYYKTQKNQIVKEFNLFGWPWVRREPSA
jgi:hypothetical protein